MMGRRDFLQGLIGLAAWLACPEGALARAVEWHPDRFPFGIGVASGSPSSDGFVLWTRLMGDDLPEEPVRVWWEVFDPVDSTRLLAEGETIALPELAHSVHVEVTGLPADRWYGYRFRVGAHRSPPGRTRTLPEPGSRGSGQIRFAYASCQHWEQGYYAAYRHMLEERLDLVLFVGDYIYEYASTQDKNAPRRHDLSHARTLQDFRARYAVYKSDPELQAMHAHCPWLVLWDDHEVENDYIGTHSIYATGNFLAMRAAAYQAFYEHQPLRASTLLEGIEGLMRGAELRIYDRVGFGQLATFHLLDSRQYRDGPVCKESMSDAQRSFCLPAGSGRSMLGSRQEQWLDAGIRECAAQGQFWNIVVQQNRVTPANYEEGEGKDASVDRWDSFPEARLRLLHALVRHQPRNTLIIGGDIHQNWVARVHRDPYDVDSPVVASEFVGTSISSRMGRPQAVAERHAARNPHCLLVNTEKRGYGVVELTPHQARVELRVLDEVRDPDSGISTLASFVVEDGRSVRRV